MGSQRQYTRMKGDSKCILMELDGSTYEAILENISHGGAFINVSEGVPNGLQDGDECSLTLCSDSGDCSTKHLCRVVRHDSANMGIQFLTTRDQ
jgi:c-di-GMP-binding flagellar brake protein YcgR